MRFVIFIVLLLSAYSVRAQSAQDSVKQVITDLFKAMNDADSAAVVNLFAPGAVIHGLGKTGVKLEKAENIGASMKRLKKGQLDERIQFEAVHIDANLAAVWTPYRLYFDGKFMHCGADSFQLIRIDGAWKIVYLIDTRRKDCGEQ